MKPSNVPLSSSEKVFLLQGIKSRKRLDGRETYDYRKLRISFGVDRGHCEVQLGRTRVLGQVSCELVEPRASRPTEGQMFINVELSPMASAAFEGGRSTEFSVELNRFMERFYVESQAIDVESLCIVAGEKVWQVKVDLHVLDNGGNIADCASIAAITALAHFRKPDVSVIGEEVTIHSPEDREPVPLSILHMPVCITFGFYDKGEFLLVDPTDKEETIMDGRMTMAMNIHREICGAVMGGGVSLESDQIIRCSKIASVKVAELTELIKASLAEDSKQRSQGKTGFIESDKKTCAITIASTDESDVNLTEAIERAEERCSEMSSVPPDFPLQSELKGHGTAQVGCGGDNTWFVIDDADDEHMEEDHEIEKADCRLKNEDEDAVTRTSRKKNGKPVVHCTVDSDSSEEEIVILTANEVRGGRENSSKATVSQEQMDLNVAIKGAKVPEEGLSRSKGRKEKKKRK